MPANSMVIARKQVGGLSAAALTRFSTRAANAVGLRGQVNILLTTNQEMKSLNLRFRGKNVATDVLSFPTSTSEWPAGFAGDIAVSVEMASKNASRLGHSAAEEVKILVLHGLLHLAGYDHERDHGAMARKEERLRTRLGLPVALIERSGLDEAIAANSRRTASRRKMAAVRRARVSPAKLARRRP
jgi:probable rRNA maturation factor